ncbi:uncharacterized protein LOC141601496 [Silene latifolia]|uniref:uncharacterized protein LOC141601496 n=1 Tax=Silene latifolia TaxID=37657 RepID=UPI003D779189
MDIWVVAAAAGAGYIAKYWQHISGDKEDVSELNEPQIPSLIERIRDKTCPIKKLSRKRSEICNGDEILSETSRREVTSHSTWNHEQGIGRHEDGSFPSESMFSAEFRDDMSGIPEDSTWELGAPSKKSQRSSRRLHLQYINPHNSLDSCVMAQMHKEQAEIEEYLLTPLSSPCTPSLRPFLVSDGKRIISRPNGKFMGRLHEKVPPKADNDVIGVPCLPQINAVDCSTQKINDKSRMEKSHLSSNIMQFDTQAVLSNGQARFCLGMSIGILFTIIANKVELEKLKFSLRQSESLVEDLQEELEMKDALIVEELVNDDDLLDVHGVLSSNEKPDGFSNKADMSSLSRYADEKSACLKEDASISNIEAELEAELERLELCMKGSIMSSELNQGFDQDLIAELVHGELQIDVLRGRSSSEPTVDRGSHSTPTPIRQSAQDGVSPHELSLRLHDVIQSRLEEKIIELETELAKSHNQINHLLVERSNYLRDVSNSGSSSSKCSPRTRETRSPISQPLVMNLSGDALDAYNEAFEELNKVKRPGEKPFQIRVESPNKQNMEDKHTWLAGRREEAVPISITGIPSSEDSTDDCYDSDGDNDDDDMMLIMQIVEKARQGSPAILRAQKAMVSLNRDH